jgi:hypothetical protein
MARPQSGSFSQLSKRSASTSLETRKMPPGLITEVGFGLHLTLFAVPDSLVLLNQSQVGC